MAQKKTNNNHNELRQEVLNEIGNLRVVSRDIISRFQSNLEAKIVWCINSLSNSEEDRPEAARDKEQLTLMLQVLEEIKLKPKKGRMKDIRRITEAVNLLYAKLLD